jgi:Uma2 family endonuclease
MGEALPISYYTIEEYLKIEETSLERLEYHDGQIFAMAGGTIDHGLITNNIGGSLREFLRKKGKNCSTYSSDVRIAINNRNYVYADTFVICGKPENYDEMKEAVKNPILIVEVSSDSTALYDREEKFRKYQSIDTFQEYVLIAQNQMLVEVYYKTKDANFWYYRSYTNPDDLIELKSIDIEIPLTEIYLNWESKVQKSI